MNGNGNGITVPHISQIAVDDTLLHELNTNTPMVWIMYIIHLHINQ